MKPVARLRNFDCGESPQARAEGAGMSIIETSGMLTREEHDSIARAIREAHIAGMKEARDMSLNSYWLGLTLALDARIAQLEAENISA